MMIRLVHFIFLSLIVVNVHCVWAAKLALVIDDFGYRQSNEQKIIALSPNITIAVLPNSPNAQKIATLAHQHGNDVIIHLPMAPTGKQPLEKDTLFPYMEESVVSRIVTDAVERVPYAIGVNNHMGSLMTSDLTGMNHVMKALSNYSMFFLDSKTIGRTKTKEAASQYAIPVLERDVFLDDKITETAIGQQFESAINVARKHGVAIAIGHPHPQTVNVLTSKLANLPDDIELIKISELIPAPELPTQNPLYLEKLLDKYRQLFELLCQFMLTKQ